MGFFEFVANGMSCKEESLSGMRMVFYILFMGIPFIGAPVAYLVAMNDHKSGNPCCDECIWFD